MVWHVHDIFEPKLASFHKYLSMEMMNKTECVLGIYNAKCYKLLLSSVFVIWLVNDINELELSFFVIISSLERTNRAKYVFKNLQHFALISHFCTF